MAEAGGENRLARRVSSWATCKQGRDLAVEAADGVIIRLVSLVRRGPLWVRSYASCW